MMYFINRFRSDDSGTFGTFLDSAAHQYCYTVERAPSGDHPCIPDGVYDFEQYNSPTKGDVWICTNPPPGRTAIEMHPANDIDDLLGCIGVGDKLGIVNGLPAVLDSQNTFKMLKSQLPTAFTVTIRSIFL